MFKNRLYRFPLLSAEEIANSPSRQDAVDAPTEAKVWRRIAKAIYDTIKNLAYPMSVGTASIAVTFFARFFMCKSIMSNSPPIIAIACLFLAGKCNDEPRRMLDIGVELLKNFYGRGNPHLRNRFAAPNFLEELQSLVDRAEKLVMFTLQFDFDIDPLILTTLNHIGKHEELVEIKKTKVFQQFLIAICNSVMLRDAPLVLQYNLEHIALSIAVYYFFKRDQQQDMGRDRHTTPPAGIDGHPWYVHCGLPEEIKTQIIDRFNRMYGSGAGNGSVEESKAVSSGFYAPAALSEAKEEATKVAPLPNDHQIVDTTIVAQPSTTMSAKNTLGGGGGGSGSGLRRMIMAGPNRSTLHEQNKAPQNKTQPTKKRVRSSWEDGNGDVDMRPELRVDHSVPTTQFQTNYRPGLLGAAVVRPVRHQQQPDAHMLQSGAAMNAKAGDRGAQQEVASDVEEGEIEEGEIL